MRTSFRFAFLFAAALVAAPFAAGDAAAQVGAHDAHVFLGDWDLAVQGDAPATIRVNITDADGQVAAVVTGLEGRETPVTGIAMENENLILRYDTSIQGQQLPIEITLTPDGENLRASLDLAGGMMTMPGTATKRAGG